MMRLFGKALLWELGIAAFWVLIMAFGSFILWENLFAAPNEFSHQLLRMFLSIGWIGAVIHYFTDKFGG